MAEIRIRGLSKSFGKTVALHPLDLEIQDGSFVCVVGPSGCGKSTFLNLVAGLEAPGQGDIFFDGRSVLELSPKQRDVAFVFQSYALYPHKSVFENIAFPLKVSKTPKAEIGQQVEDVSRLLEIEDLLGRRPKELSGGQKQRVALARAIIRRPKVFLLDEPLSNLDAQLRVQTRAELKRLHQRLKTTFVYVTHDQTEAMSLADQIMVLKGGVLQQTGTAREVYDTPLNTFVASFIGTPGMNFLKGWVQKEENQIRVGEVNYAMPGGIERTGEIRIGVRPENISLVEVRRNQTHTGSVYVVEPLGSEVLVEIEFGGSRLAAKAGPDFALKPGAQILFELDIDRACFFDSQSGKNIVT
jgi:ABC-type sugar transport system ATPase subunit